MFSANTQNNRQPMDIDGAPWGWLTIAVLLTIAVFRLVALYFNATGLMFDEAQYWLWGKEPAFGYFSKPPLLGWTISFFTFVCGSDSEFCVRLPSPVIHTGTALLIYLTAKNLFDRRTAFWAAIIFATTPGISYSASFITTDVPLLFCWAGALLTFIRLLERATWINAAFLGIFLGFGILAKYAMVYFLMCAVVLALFDKTVRKALLSIKFSVSMVIAAVIVSPNIWWNASHGFVTASHTNKNIGWRSGVLYPDRMLEFLGSQLGVFGPVLLVIYVIAVFQLVSRGAGNAQRLLMAFSLPVILLMTFQGLMSKAYANWAAVAYVGAAILVADVIINRMEPLWNRLSLSIHAGVMLAVSLIMIFSTPGQLPMIAEMKFIQRLQGWREIARLTDKQLDKKDYSAIIAPRRHLTAEMVYYLRHRKEKVFAFRSGGPLRDHYQLTRAYEGDPDGKILLISTTDNITHFRTRFNTINPVGKVEIGAGNNKTIWFYDLQDYQAAN